MTDTDTDTRSWVPGFVDAEFLKLVAFIIVPWWAYAFNLLPFEEIAITLLVVIAVGVWLNE